MKYCFYLFVLVLFSCQQLSNDKEKEVVVEYKGHYLYKEDLAKILPQTYSKEDSINLVEPFIRNWLNKKVTVNNATLRISEEEIQELDQHISQYREDLILNKFYNQQLEKLNEDDIPEQELIDYYHDNKNSFVLNEDIVQVQYIIAPTSAKDVILNNVENSDALKDICKKNSNIECNSSDEWVNFEQSLSMFDLNKNETSMEGLKQNSLMKFEKDGKFYLVKWLGFKTKGETGPYEYFKNTIKSILINKRKLNLQKHIEDSLYNDAITNDKIKFYE